MIDGTSRSFVFLLAISLAPFSPLCARAGAADTASVQGAAANPGGAITEPRVERLDPALDRIMPAHPTVEKVAGVFSWTEGPVWIPAGYLLFAEIPSNSIRKLTRDGQVTIFMQPSGYKGSAPYGGAQPGSNGMTLDRRGRLTVAGNAQRDVWRLESLNPKAQITILADKYQGKRLSSPNDLVYGPDGSLYFTDPPFGLPTHDDNDPTKHLKVNGVYRIPGALYQKPGAPPAEGRLQLVIGDLTRPNGLAFSPDGKFLYVDNSGPKKLWMRYRVSSDGSLSDATVFFDASAWDRITGSPDGMKIDREGNIYTAGPGGLWIFSPSGKRLGAIDVPGGRVGNEAWGGADFKTLYIMAGPNVYRVKLKIPGMHPSQFIGSHSSAKTP